MLKRKVENMTILLKRILEQIIVIYKNIKWIFWNCKVQYLKLQIHWMGLKATDRIGKHKGQYKLSKLGLPWWSSG